MFRKALATTRSKIIAVAGAATLVAGLGVVLAGPAQAVNCAFGDNFYYFHSMWTGNRQLYTYRDDYGFYVLGDNTPESGTPMCQVRSEQGNGWYGWVIKNTDLALTWNQDGHTTWWKPWADLTSQRWLLSDQLVQGEEKWGGVLNDYVNSEGYNCWLIQSGKGPADPVGTAWCTTVWPFWETGPPHDIMTNAGTSWQLDGPVP